MFPLLFYDHDDSDKVSPATTTTTNTTAPTGADVTKQDNENQWQRAGERENWGTLSCLAATTTTTAAATATADDDERESWGMLSCSALPFNFILMVIV